MGDYEKAIPNFKWVLEICPDDDVAAYQLGMAYYHARKLSDATEHFRARVALNPSDKRSEEMLEMITMVPAI
jgi:TolA-binding protein